MHTKIYISYRYVAIEILFSAKSCIVQMNNKPCNTNVINFWNRQTRKYVLSIHLKSSHDVCFKQNVYVNITYFLNYLVRLSLIIFVSNMLIMMMFFYKVKAP